MIRKDPGWGWYARETTIYPTFLPGPPFASRGEKRTPWRGWYARETTIYPTFRLGPPFASRGRSLNSRNEKKGFWRGWYARETTIYPTFRLGPPFAFRGRSINSRNEKKGPLGEADTRQKWQLAHHFCLVPLRLQRPVLKLKKWEKGPLARLIC